MYPTRRAALLILLVSLCAGTPPALAGKASGKGPSASELIELAKRDIATKEGAAYDEVIGRGFSERHVDLVANCVKAHGPSQVEPFSLVIVVGETGAVTQVVASPDTPTARCIKMDIVKEHFSKPPFAPFHDLIEMSFK